MIARRLAIIATGLLLAAPVATAQTASQPRAPRASRQPAVPNSAELATILDAYAIVQAQKALQLTDDQYGRFVSKLKGLQDTRRRNAQTRRRLLLELRKLAADPGADDSTIRDRLAALRALDEEAASAIRREYAEIDAVLDPRQQVRFRILEQQLERRKLDLLVRARQRAARARPDAP